MRILHIGGKMSIGGAERAIFQLIQAQRAAGYGADLLAALSNGYFAQKVNETGAKVFEIRMRKAWDISVKKRFLEIIRNYDGIHFHGPAPALIYLASRQSSSKLFYTHRAGIFQYPFKRLLSYKISGYFLKKSFAKISGNTKHAVLAASRLFNMSHEKIYVTYNGINFSLLEPKRGRQEVLSELRDSRMNVIRIGTSANIRDLKRIDYILKAIAEIKSYPIHCYIIGDGPERKNLEKLSDDLGVSELITFTGQKKEIADYLQILDIFVLASNTCESFGNSAVEAMAMGIPTIVMRDGGGLIEHISDGSGFIAESFKDISILLRELCNSEELRLSVGEKGKKHVREKYTIDKMVKSYEVFYNKTENR